MELSRAEISRRIIRVRRYEPFAGEALHSADQDAETREVHDLETRDIIQHIDSVSSGSGTINDFCNFIFLTGWIGAMWLERLGGMHGDESFAAFLEQSFRVASDRARIF